MRKTWMIAAAAAALTLSACVAYPDGPDTYTYAPYYGYPAYGYYGPAFVSGSFYYYDGPRRYWGPPPYYRGPYRGSYHRPYHRSDHWRGRDFSGHHRDGPRR